MNTDPPLKHLSPDDIVHELADGLRDVVRETDEAYLKKEPDDAYIDLAFRLVLRLSQKITIVSVDDVVRAYAHSAHIEAACRILTVFTDWMLKHPGHSLVTELNDRFAITVKRADKTIAFFQGETIQDAYAQAAQTICLEEPL